MKKITSQGHFFPSLESALAKKKKNKFFCKPNQQCEQQLRSPRRDPSPAPAVAPSSPLCPRPRGRRSAAAFGEQFFAIESNRRAKRENKNVGRGATSSLSFASRLPLSFSPQLSRLRAAASLTLNHTITTPPQPRVPPRRLHLCRTAREQQQQQQQQRRGSSRDTHSRDASFLDTSSSFEKGRGLDDGHRHGSHLRRHRRCLPRARLHFKFSRGPGPPAAGGVRAVKEKKEEEGDEKRRRKRSSFFSFSGRLSLKKTKEVLFFPARLSAFFSIASDFLVSFM